MTHPTSNLRNASLDQLRLVLAEWPDDAAVFRPGIDWIVSDSATRPSLTAGDVKTVLNELERLRKTCAQIGPDRLTAYEEDAGLLQQEMEPDTSPLSHMEILSAVSHHAREIARLTETVPVKCSPDETSARREYHANGTYWSGVPTVDMPCDFCKQGIVAHDPRTHACPPAETSTELFEIVREVATMDCFYSGATHDPDCKCIVGRAERAINPSSAVKSTAPISKQEPLT